MTMTKAKKIGRPSMGITKKVSLTLSKETWWWLENEAQGNLSALLRDLIIGSQSNAPTLGYALLGAKDLGYSNLEILQLINAISPHMNNVTRDEAATMFEQEITHIIERER